MTGNAKASVTTPSVTTARSLGTGQQAASIDDDAVSFTAPQPTQANGNRTTGENKEEWKTTTGQPPLQSISTSLFPSFKASLIEYMQ
jgi:hypothetical protein